MSVAPDPVGVVGLGLVGAAIAARLGDAGFAILGWDVDPARREALGEHAAPSLAALAERCGAVLVAVYDASQAATVFDGWPATARAHTVISVTTCGPDEVARLAERSTGLGLTFLEFPISGTSRQIRDGAATGLLAGPPEGAARVEPILRAVCPTVMPVGAVGAAARAKLVVNLVLQLNRAALAEGLALAESLGLDPALALALLRSSAAGSQVMDTKGEKMVRSDYRAESRIAQTLKDATLILSAAAAAGQTLPLCEVQASLLRDAVANGGGDRDSSAVIEAIRSRRRAPPTQDTA